MGAYHAPSADVGGLFRDTAEAETGHAHGHLDYLKAAGDPATDKPIGSTDKNLVAAVAGQLLGWGVFAVAAVAVLYRRGLHALDVGGG